MAKHLKPGPHHTFSSPLETHRSLYLQTALEQPCPQTLSPILTTAAGYCALSLPLLLLLPRHCTALRHGVSIAIPGCVLLQRTGMLFLLHGCYLLEPCSLLQIWYQMLRKSQLLPRETSRSPSHTRPPLEVSQGLQSLTWDRGNHMAILKQFEPNLWIQCTVEASHSPAVLSRLKYPQSNHSP